MYTVSVCQRCKCSGPHVSHWFIHWFLFLIFVITRKNFLFKLWVNNFPHASIILSTNFVVTKLSIFLKQLKQTFTYFFHQMQGSCKKLSVFFFRDKQPCLRKERITISSSYISYTYSYIDLSPQSDANIAACRTKRESTLLFSFILMNPITKWHCYIWLLQKQV